jgi:hypothetical protein
MFADLNQYFWALLSNWAAFMTGGFTAAAVLLVERLRGRQFALRTWLAVFVVFGFVAASYQTWHDQYVQQSQKSVLRAKHVAQLQEFWIVGGRILNENLTKDTSKDDFDKWVNSANMWVNDTAKWIGDNMGAAARERFLDTSGMMAMTYSRAISSEHNQAVQNIIRFRDNLRYLMDNESWDKG